MSVTGATLVSDTERHLLSGDRDEINLLTSLTNSSATTLTFTYDLGGINQGSYIAIDLEIMYVWSTDPSGKTAVVQRAMVGSIAASHAASSLVYVNPKFSKYDIFNALNVEIRDMSGPDGLWQIKDFTLTTSAVAWTYAVPSDNTDLMDIAEVRWQPPGADQRWALVQRRAIQILRNMPTSGTGFASGLGLRIEEPFTPGCVLTVRYKAPLVELATLDDIVTSVTGMPASAVDIPPLGAAARLMGVREAKRSFTENAVDTRRAGEVPPGSAVRSSQELMALVRQRMQSEHNSLLRDYP